MIRAVRSIALAGLALAIAQSTCAQTNVSRVQERSSQTASALREATRLDPTDVLLGQIWGLSLEEMQRAKVLLDGPRRAFSVENLSPVEALGIHARNDAERRKYAEMMARAVREDVQRSLAWSAAYNEAMTRLYGREPVVDFSKLPKVMVPVGAADAANVPRSLIIEPPPAAMDAARR